jgi:hypothetical protein
MSVLLALFLSLHLGSCSTKILYDFSINFNTQIDDSSGNSNHGNKVAYGTTATTVNTPYGLYLAGTTADLPPNSYAGTGLSNVLNSSNDFSMAVFVRYIQGLAGLQARPLITLKNGTTTRLTLGTPNGFNTSAPVWTFTVNFGGTATTVSAATGYALSKPYIDKWYFLVISVDSQTGSGTSIISMCINGVLINTATHNRENTKDFNANTLNGLYTKAIYYSFQYEDTANTCSFFDNSYDLGGSCSYVCYQGGGVPCGVDTIQYDTTCTSCSTNCGNYGCVQYSPLICYNTICPPSTYTDANCNSCYANSKKTVGVNSCSCSAGFAQTAANPLTCSACGTVAAVYAANSCPSCYADSYNDAVGLTCTCNAGYFNSSPSSVVCTGKD